MSEYPKSKHTTQHQYFHTRPHCKKSRVAHAQPKAALNICVSFKCHARQLVPYSPIHQRRGQVARYIGRWLQQEHNMTLPSPTTLFIYLIYKHWQCFSKSYSKQSCKVSYLSINTLKVLSFAQSLVCMISLTKAKKKIRLPFASD